MRNRKNFKFTAKLEINGVAIEDRFMYSLVIDRDFMGNRFPLIMLTLNLDYVVYSELVKDLVPNKPYLDCHLDVFSRETEHETSPLKFYMGGRYMGIIDQQHSVLSRSTESNLDRTKNSQQQELKAVRVSLFKEQDLPSMQGMINGIYDGGQSMSTMILRAFGKCSKGIKLCMAQPDNRTIDTDLVLEPMGFYQFMNHIDTEYVVYKTPYNMYIEDSVMYMLHSENDPGITIDGKSSKLIVETLGPEYVEQYYTIRYEVEGDIVTAPETNALIESPSFRHTANILNSEIIDGSKVMIKNAMTHTVNFKNYTKRGRIRRDDDAEYDITKVVLDRLRLDILPHTVVELRSMSYVHKYRVSRHLKVISFDNDSVDTLILQRIIK